MLTGKKSNIFLISGLLMATLSGCMQELAEVEYNSTEEGYETVVAQNMNAKAETRIAQNAGGRGPVVVINNPYALSDSNISNHTPSGSAAAYNVPVINNNAYGSLNGGIIQSGVFMQNTTKTYQPPTYGARIYSPTSR